MVGRDWSALNINLTSTNESNLGLSRKFQRDQPGEFFVYRRDTAQARISGTQIVQMTCYVPSDRAEILTCTRSPPFPNPFSTVVQLVLYKEKFVLRINTYIRP